jgi:acetolactate synthase-1/2/3 large subunit
MRITGSHLIARALKAEGVTKVFTLAGDHTLPLMDLMAQEGFDFIDTRHEQGAVHMANAWSRITGSPGVCLFTTPGHANAIAGLALAQHMEAPVINIVGCADQDRLGQGAAQELDQIGMANPVTKGAWFVGDPRRIPEYLARAFRTALTGRRGPVHLTVPLDVQAAEVEESEVRFYGPELYRPTGQTLGDPQRVKEAVELLHSAERPLMLAGSGAYTASAQALERLLEVTRVPLFTEEAARGLVSDGHPYCFGYADGRVNDAARMLDRADLVLLLGKKLDFTVSFGGPPTFDPEVKIIQVESSVDMVGTPRGVDVSVLADVGAVVEQMAAEAESYTWGPSPLLPELESARESQLDDLESVAAGPGLNSMSVHRQLRPLLEEDTCIVFEGSDFGFYGASYYPTTAPGRWFTNGTMGMIGWGVPFAVGAKAALPGTRVVLLTGDGAFGFHPMELDTAVRHDLPIVVVVGNDAVWGIDYHQQVQLYGRSVATELLPTRYDLLGEALGAHAEHVEEEAELAPALKRALGSGRPAVVNVRIAPSPSPLTEHIIRAKQADQRADG